MKRDMASLSRSSVKVGITHAGDGDGETVEHAVLNEFGTEHIPARPFMRRTADTHEKDTYRIARASVASMLVGRLSVDGVLEQMGSFYRGWMRGMLNTSKSWAVPNAPRTLEMKKGDKPLFDTGDVERSINYEKVRR
ncbi:hypothetical protein [Roseomonas haemaphysalidis]|uniref:Phage portal protein n=1 Tax=Roseomonas haemaphysalidis TaxID=2768162 RepID=A0ABS3KZU5_9PROT|nr:hypothetical protein [Roseomonas haemaphysalidis]MBO1081831.1 hypothetical protein [Roseomonas haemaphysalidis]